MTISTVIITRNSNNDKIAMAFTKCTYGDLKAQSAQIAANLVNSLVGKTDKVNGKVVTLEDAQQAVLEEIATLTNNNEDNGSVSWATSMGNGVIVHNTTGVQYFQGSCMKTIILEKGEEQKETKQTGSRNGVTLAKKELRSMLPISTWKMAKLSDGSERYDGIDAVTVWEMLTK